MDPTLDFRLSALVKELARKDAEARALKQELELFERSEVMNLHEDRDEGEGGATAGGGGHLQHRIPREDQGKLIDARNFLKEQGDELVLAVAEKEASVDRMSVAAAHTDALRTELELMYEAANWRPGDFYGYIDKVRIDNQVEGSRIDIEELLRIKNTEVAQIALQSQQMKDYAQQLQDSASYEKDLFDTNTELKVILEQIDSAKEEINSLSRVFQRKELLLNRSESFDDTVDLKTTEANKRLNGMKMVKHREAMRQNDVMIRNQALRIQKFEDKLEMIGEAVRGDDGEEVERVDADVLTDVQREIKTLKLTQGAQTKDLVTLDEQVQQADGTMRTLTKQKSVTDKRVTKAVQDHKLMKRKLKEQSQVAQMNADRMIAEQRRRNEDTKAMATLTQKDAQRSEQRKRRYDEELHQRNHAEEERRRAGKDAERKQKVNPEGSSQKNQDEKEEEAPSTPTKKGEEDSTSTTTTTAAASEEEEPSAAAQLEEGTAAEEGDQAEPAAAADEKAQEEAAQEITPAQMNAENADKPQGSEEPATQQEGEATTSATPEDPAPGAEEEDEEATTTTTPTPPATTDAATEDKKEEEEDDVTTTEEGKAEATSTTSEEKKEEEEVIKDETVEEKEVETTAASTDDSAAELESSSAPAQPDSSEKESSPATTTDEEKKEAAHTTEDAAPGPKTEEEKAE